MTRRKNPTETGRAGIQQSVLNYAKKRGLLYLRTHMGRGVTTGWPDTFLFPDQSCIVTVEFKRLGEEPTVIQAHRHRELRARGYRVEVIDSIEAGRALVDDLVGPL